MIAPKPAISGNGHAAMQRTISPDTQLMDNQQLVKKQATKQTKKSKKK